MKTSLVISASILCIGLSLAAEHPVYQPGGDQEHYSLGSSSSFPHHQYPPPYVTLEEQAPQQYQFQQHPVEQQQQQTQELTPQYQPHHPAQELAPQQQQHPAPAQELTSQQQLPGLPSDERIGGFFPYGNYAVGLGGGGGPPGEGYGPGGPGPNGPYGVPGGQPPPYGFPDPSFQTQAGFEGLLVPNTWYGLLPWGIEGVIIVIAGIIVFAIIVIAIIGLLLWLCGIRSALPFIIKRDGEGLDSELRSRRSDPWSLVNLSADVMDAIEKFNEVSVLDEAGSKKKV